MAAGGGEQDLRVGGANDFYMAYMIFQFFSSKWLIKSVIPCYCESYCESILSFLDRKVVRSDLVGFSCIPCRFPICCCDALWHLAEELLFLKAG